MPCYRLIVVALFALLLAAGCGSDRAQAPAPYAADPQQRPRSVVVWISVDGVRPDYIERSETPLLDRMMSQGAYSLAMDPGFPALTFPGHVTQATGGGVEHHGVSGNSFYDERTGRPIRYPDNPELLEAEPIWITAPRQGVRTAVFDWPLCHNQPGPARSDYFSPRYERDLTDQQRLDRLIDTWRDDDHQQPLRLLMAYIPSVDATGHTYGPDSPQVQDAMAEADRLLGRLFERSRRLFGQRMTEGDRLYFIISTDHGMAPVHTLVNLRSLLEEIELPEQAQTITSANIANIHLDQLPAEQRELLAGRMIDALDGHDFLEVYRRDELPPQLNYRHPRRVGDLVILLAPGYTFNTRLPRPTYPVEEVGSPLGMHGYSAAASEDMLGIALFWSSDGLGGIDLGPIHGQHLHAIVAHLLEIEPAEGAARAPAAVLERLSR